MLRTEGQSPHLNGWGPATGGVNGGVNGGIHGVGVGVWVVGVFGTTHGRVHVSGAIRVPYPTSGTGSDTVTGGG